jgi:hypothetical protein
MHAHAAERKAVAAVDDEVGGGSWALNGLVVVFRGRAPGDPSSVVLATRARAGQPDLAWSVDVDGEVPISTRVPPQQVDALYEHNPVRAHLHQPVEVVGRPVVAAEPGGLPSPPGRPFVLELGAGQDRTQCV